MPLRIAIVGLGKIAHDQHLPAIAASDDFTLVAAASREGGVDGVPVFASTQELLDSGIAFDAVAMCQPPQARFDCASRALAAGKHVLLEKPPGATLAEVEALTRQADAAGLTLFAAWHSRFAPGVEVARAWLADKAIHSAELVWKEDVRRWHPGQAWIWRAGGLGVFDPGINGLSILTRILPNLVFLQHGTIEVPANVQAPIAAKLTLTDLKGAAITAAFDWRQTGPQSWDIHVETSGGSLSLTHGGSALAIDNVVQPLEGEAEYASLYRHFAALIGEGQSDHDRSPLRLVADAFLRCDRVLVEEFHD